MFIVYRILNNPKAIYARSVQSWYKQEGLLQIDLADGQDSADTVLCTDSGVYYLDSTEEPIDILEMSPDIRKY